MKVFISWSGERSKAVAAALRDWLRIVIPNSEPWLSKDDIRKGSRWGAELATVLQDCQFGIICLAPDNIDRPWILFEAGALSKTLTDTYVCPFLFELEPSQIVGPLEQFQAVVFEKEDLRTLVRNINEAQKTSALRDDVLDKLFELAWPELETKLASIPPSRLLKSTKGPPKRWFARFSREFGQIKERQKREKAHTARRETVSFHSCLDSFKPVSQVLILCPLILPKTLKIGM